MCLDSTPRPRSARPTLVDLRSARSGRGWCLGHHTTLDYRRAHGTWPLGGGGQRRARRGARIHRSRQHAHQPSATLVSDALARRLTWHHLPPPYTRSLIHIAIPAPHCHVAKCSIFVAQGLGGPLPFSTSSILARRRHSSTPSRTHPQHAGARRRRTGAYLFLARPCTPLPLLEVVSRHTWRFSSLLSGFPPFFLAGLSFFLSGLYLPARSPPARTRLC